jgi:hypothetical protein
VDERGGKCKRDGKKRNYKGMGKKEGGKEKINLERERKRDLEKWGWTKKKTRKNKGKEKIEKGKRKGEDTWKEK